MPLYKPIAEMRAMQDAACEAFGVPRRAVFSQRRDRHVLLARYAIAWVLHYKFKRGLVEIGRMMDRDHSTIFTQLQRAEYLRDTDPAFREVTDAL